MSEWTISTLKEHFDQRFHDSDVAVRSALDAADKASDKAERAMEKRLDAVNEFRQAYEALIATGMPRAEIESRLSSMNDRIESNTKGQNRGEGSASANDRLWARLGPMIALTGVVAGVLIAVFH